MSTNAYITKVNGNGDATSIYLHFDGDRALQTLREHYATQERVDALFALGNLSSLGAELTCVYDYNAEHMSSEYRGDKPYRCLTGDKPGELKYTVAYNRDYGRDDDEVELFDSLDEACGYVEDEIHLV